MDGPWTQNEFVSVDLGDERLNKRLATISCRFAQSPLSPINHACDDWAETKAAYRFFSNEKITHQEITKSHIAATKERCREYSTVLAIQDTTYFNYSSHLGTTGLCPLGRKKGRHKDQIATVGLVMHSTLAVSTDGLPLGIIDQKIYARPQLSEAIKEVKRKSHNNALAMEEKDSYRWIEAFKNTHTHFKDFPARVVTVGDREADMYDLFHCAQELKASVLIRANFNRTVNRKSMYSEKSGEALWNLMKKKKTQAQITVHVPEKESRPARIAKCIVTFSEFTMRPPRNHVDPQVKNRPALLLYAIHVTEKNPPPDIDRIDWMLVTDIPLLTAEEALEKIAWYCLRWRIEILHKILKSGLKVEECRLSTSARLIRYLAVMSIVAWRIFWVTLVARVAPDASCRIFLSDFEWNILAAKFDKDKNQEQQVPTLEQSIKWIARLGGFLARKGDKQPGITHVWRGMKKFSAMLEGAELARNIYG